MTGSLLARFVAAILLAAVLAFGAGVALAQEATVAAPEPLAEGPISTVNGVEIAAADFQQRVQTTRFLYGFTIRETIRGLLGAGYEPNQALQMAQNFFATEIDRMLIADLMGVAVLGRMDEAALLNQLAPEYGVDVTDEAVDAQIEQFVQRPRSLTASPEATPEPTPAGALRDLFAEAERRLGVSEEVVRAYFRDQLLRGRFIDVVAGPFPQEAAFITVRHILVGSESEAGDVLARLDAGEDFAALARELSIDTASAARGGALGTAVADLFVDPFADAVRDAPLNQIVGPVETSFGYHIAEVEARETRPLDPESAAALQQARTTRFETWLGDQMAGADVEHVPDWPDLIPAHPSGEVLLSNMLGDL